jgi:hypothetical protein
MPRAALAVTLLLACSPLESTDTGSSGTTGEPTGTPQVTVVGQVDLIDLCGVEGAQSVTFLARKVGCEPGPPAPCTLKVDPYMEYSGDLVPCPASETLREMSVAVPVTGRFHIEARTTTSSGTLSRCYGRDGDLPTVITAAEIESRDQIFVETTATACPSI